MSGTFADMFPFSNILIKVLEGLKIFAFNDTSEFYQTVLFDDCNWTQTHDHLICNRILRNYLAKLAKHS